MVISNLVVVFEFSGFLWLSRMLRPLDWLFVLEAGTHADKNEPTQNHIARFVVVVVVDRN